MFNMMHFIVSISFVKLRLILDRFCFPDGFYQDHIIFVVISGGSLLTEDDIIVSQDVWRQGIHNGIKSDH